jgi:hypothetical protein
MSILGWTSAALCDFNASPMVTAEEFLGASRVCGLSFFPGTPCADRKPLINGAPNDAALGFRDAVNGGEAAAGAAGAYLATVAPACGYARAVGTDSLAVLAQELAAHTVRRGPTLVHFRTRTGTLAKLGRPKISPAEAKTRRMQWLNLP